MRFATLLAIALVSSVHLSSALAADPIAEATFQEGLALLQASRFDEACRLLAASHAREPKSGTLVVLASCHTQLGRTATAWAEYKEAAALARAEGRPSHADKANELAAELASRLASLRVELALPHAAGLVVELDGAPMHEGTFAIALPVDPGQHVLTATAPGKLTWSEGFALDDAEQRIIVIPSLAPVPAAPVPPRDAASPVPRVEQRAPPPTPPPMWPWIVTGVGLAALGASATSLAISSSAGAELDDACGEARNLCPLAYDDGPVRTAELAGFGLFFGFGIAGVAGVATGLVGLLSQPDGSATTRVSVSAEQTRIDVSLPF